MGLSGVAVLEVVLRALLRWALAQEERTEYTLDPDATAIEAHKESAQWTYKGFRRYYPMMRHLAENGLVIAHEFREGSDSPHARNLEFYQACKAAMPPGKRIVAYRADSAAFQGALLDELSGDGVVYAVGADLDTAVREAIGTIPPERWKPYRDGYVAETVHTMNKMRHAFRLVVFKRLGQGSLFEEKGAFYHAVASSREEGPEATMDWYHARGEHSENRIKELKCDFAMERMPSGSLRPTRSFSPSACSLITCSSSSRGASCLPSTAEPARARCAIGSTAWRARSCGRAGLSA